MVEASEARLVSKEEQTKLLALVILGITMVLKRN